MSEAHLQHPHRREPERRGAISALPPDTGPVRKIRHPRPSRAKGLPKVYSSMNVFLKRRGGRESAEFDYGNDNRDDCGLVAPYEQPQVRISHVLDTGDVYAINESEMENSRVALLAVMVEPDGVPMSYGRVNRILNGWKDARGSQTISWFLRRLNNPPA